MTKETESQFSNKNLLFYIYAVQDIDVVLCFVPPLFFFFYLQMIARIDRCGDVLFGKR